jgi:transposase-like protein
MNELKNRGVQDVLIFAVDNLSGISEAIMAAFPHSEIQKCIVHQIRTSLRFVTWKERKVVAEDLKPVYKAPTEESALQNLDLFAQKWDGRYPHIAKSWRKNWFEISPFFKFSKAIRTLMYTTNPIETFNRGIRKVTKTRAMFPTKDSALKLLYLATEEMEQKWRCPLPNWGEVFSELMIFFGERVERYV